VSKWSSRIVDPDLMTSVMTSWNLASWKFQMTMISLERVVRSTSCLILGAYCQQWVNHIPSQSSRTFSLPPITSSHSYVKASDPTFNSRRYMYINFWLRLIDTTKINVICWFKWPNAIFSLSSSSTKSTLLQLQQLGSVWETLGHYMRSYYELNRSRYCALDSAININQLDL